MQLEIQEFVNGVGGMPVTLYDGAIASLPGACIVVAASSINLIGTMRAIEPDQSWIGLGGEHAAERRLRIRGALARRPKRLSATWRRTGKVVFYTGYAPVAGEQIAVSYRTVGRAVGRAVNTASQQALAQAGSPCGGRVDRLGDRSPGAQLRGLPQCGAGDGAGGGRRERVVERHLQGDKSQLCHRCLAGRCAAAECAFDQPERAGGGANGEGELSGKLSRPGGVCTSLSPTTGPTIWPSRPARRCLRMRGCRRRSLPLCLPI